MGAARYAGFSDAVIDGTTFPGVSAYSTLPEYIGVHEIDVTLFHCYSAHRSGWDDEDDSVAETLAHVIARGFVSSGSVTGFVGEVGFSTLSIGFKSAGFTALGPSAGDTERIGKEIVKATRNQIVSIAGIDSVGEGIFVSGSYLSTHAIEQFRTDMDTAINSNDAKTAIQNAVIAALGDGTIVTLREEAAASWFTNLELVGQEKGFDIFPVGIKGG
jgi:hypothetical protein